MEGDDYAALVEDIRVNGLRESIWIDKSGRVLDGRNRQRACKDSGRVPAFRTYEGSDPVGFVLSLNLHRRHLNASQRAVLALEVERLEAEEARKRQGKRTDLRDNIPELVPESSTHAAESRERAGARVGVSGRYVQDAKAVADKAPELVPEIAAGNLTIPEAKKQIRQAEKAERVAAIAAQEPAPLEAVGTFPVLLVDPPWRYEHAEPTRAVENHYPTMALDEIKALKVPADDDAVLFMWSTSPKLTEAIEVLDAWGFTYRTCAVWVKQQIGMGYYFRQRHELLLVAVRGSLRVPDPEDRPDSVIEAHRDEHSKKPPLVYSLIERMYPEHRKVELFARAARNGWAAWGNQAAEAVA